MFGDFDTKSRPGGAPRRLRSAPGRARGSPGRASARFWRAPKTDLFRDPVLVSKGGSQRRSGATLLIKDHVNSNFRLERQERKPCEFLFNAVMFHCFRECSMASFLSWLIA